MKNLFILIAFLIPSLIFCQQAEKIFKVVEEMPLFPGCAETGDDAKSKSECSKQNLLEYIYTNLKYPAEARANKIEGMVVIQFVINNDGSIYDAKIVRDIGHGCGQAALKVVNSMSDLVTQDTIRIFDDQTYTETVKVVSNKQLWSPGYQRGKAVKVLYTLPVRYKLQGDTKKVDQVVKDDSEKRVTTWTTFPPEYGSYQRYKEQLIIPNLIQETFTIDPIESSKIVGNIIPYGEAMHPLLKKMGSHNGIDFRAVPGVSVMATADGVIELLGTDHERYGQFVRIKHSEETHSLYAHLSAINVQEGQSVKAGDQIGAVGMSGKATYPHLHYEVHINGQTENPIIDGRDQIIATEDRQQSIQIKNNISEDLKPLMAIHGKIQASNFDIASLNQDDIEAISVFKGEKAIEKYGETAVNGVVDITLKADKVSKENKIDNVLAVQFDLQQNYPNPVLDNTTIRFNLPNSNPASLLFYNQSGEFVYGIKNGLTQGNNEINISKNELNTSGMIYYFLIQDRLTAAKKMILTK